jgi:hypothetical protein
LIAIVTAVAAVPAAADTPAGRADDLRLRKKCPKGFKKVRRHGRRVCRRVKAPTPTPAPTPPAPDPATQILDDTHELATKYATEKVSASKNMLPSTYQFAIDRNECELVDYNTGRCTVFLWVLEESSGYGWGGFEAGVWRESYFARHIGNRVYSPRIVMIDFIDPYYWVCSDQPRYNVPPCST